MPDIDLVITWPKTRPLYSYLRELSKAQDAGELINYRIARPPSDEWRLQLAYRSARCFIVHDGFIQGYNRIRGIEEKGENEVTDPITGAFWPSGWYIVREPEWHPIEPIPMKGFRGWRYFDTLEPEKPVERWTAEDYAKYYENPEKIDYPWIPDQAEIADPWNPSDEEIQEVIDIFDKSFLGIELESERLVDWNPIFEEPTRVKKYRKKPVVIEALLLDHLTPLEDLLDFLGDTPFEFDDAGIDIPTLEGIIHASPGDYIIKGIQNEFYPCKPDIFHQTYELVEDVS
jgi:hypothetical protein